MSDCTLHMDQVKCAIVQRKKADSDELLTIVVPLIDHPHNDIANGQYHYHYHSDGRYTGPQPHLKDLIEKDYKVSHYPNRVLGSPEIRQFDLIQYSENLAGVPDTPAQIRNTKLKCTKLIEGKCPHRGFDMSDIEPDEEGVRRCPLHGLRFDLKGELIQ